MLDKNIVDKIFDEATEQGEALIAIYKAEFPEWENIKKISGHPSIGYFGWKYICRKFVDFDKKYHPKVMAGGLWVDMGFSSDNKLGDWDVSKDFCNVSYKQVYQGA